MLLMRRSRIETGNPATRDWLGTDAKVVRHVRVCGEGHLAVATRIELNRLGIQRDTDFLLPSLRPDLVIACADSETDQSFHSIAQQAVNEGSPLLFGCLAGRILRLGPLIDPAGCAPIEADTHRPPPSVLYPHPETSTTREPPLGIAEADPRLNLYARLGALLLSAQALSFLLGARNQCVLDRAVEFNPWSMESKGYRVLKVRQ
jgi:hypothetical protein